jgi:hypothetical protein
MDFVPEKPMLEVDKIRPSRPGGKGVSGEATIEDADGKVLLPIMPSEEEEPTLVHTIVDEELLPSVMEVALPLAIIIDLNAILGLADAALLQHGTSHLLAVHRFHELGWKAEEVLRPSEYWDYAGGPPFG